MSIEERYELVQKWMNGHITEPERQALRAVYISENGMPTNTCRPCQWDDIKHYFRYQLKQQGYITMNSKKYLIAASNGIFIDYNTGKGYANEGPYNSNRNELTEEIAEALLKQNPDLKEQIIKNPEYKTPEEIRKEKADKAVTNLKAESKKETGKEAPKADPETK